MHESHGRERCSEGNGIFPIFKYREFHCEIEIPILELHFPILKHGISLRNRNSHFDMGFHNLKIGNVKCCLQNKPHLQVVSCAFRFSIELSMTSKLLEDQEIHFDLSPKEIQCLPRSMN